MKHLYEEIFNQEIKLKSLTKEVSYKEIDALDIPKEDSPVWNQDALYLSRLVTQIIRSRLNGQ